MTDKEFADFFIETAKNCYIQVYGIEKWNRLTEQEKHDLVMILANDFRRK